MEAGPIHAHTRLTQLVGRAVVVAVGCSLLVGAVGAAGRQPAAASAASTVAGADAGSAVLIGAGDICVTPTSRNAQATADLILAEPSAHVFTAGDDSNEAGTPGEYADCYDRTWGAFLDRTNAAVGNHDYFTEDARPYFAYFRQAAGPEGLGYYSYDLGAWHVVVLNGNCQAVGGCSYGSAQEHWLRQDLAAHRSLCTLAYWHQPRFSSGAPGQGSDAAYSLFWQDLYRAGAEIVINGHAHDYERFAPQDPWADRDPAGIREFIVGTGGAGQLPFGTLAANSEVRHSGTYGVLRLSLEPTAYSWEFLPVAGGTFADAGRGDCH